ncbi:hypothetical protein COO59_20430 [Mixta theicola]|uniref:CdiI immunity protein domain-containing protein n=1 Tax=Mixta theicola TaxID=1458355 RepID=A0A2K1Q4K2_9GAMM|nr:contact-dependent growth inhibition system immunity protein [Mixta theicola]PNS09887.1 hypothetical protein COO59_20430 [Mixta theicola]GLR10900.1 hypothetical protein GCM10007905_36200 [Mixta theicola]
MTLTQTYFGQDRDIFGETIEEVVDSYCENGENATRWLKNEITEMLRTEDESELTARMELLAENQFSPELWGETWRSFLLRVLAALQ